MPGATCAAWGAYYLQQSVCVLPATAKTTRAVTTARDASARGGRPGPDASHQAHRRPPGGGDHRCDPGASGRMSTASWPRARRSSMRRSRSSAAAAGRCIPSSRSPTPTSLATRNGLPRSAAATTSTRPGVGGPPRPSRRARRRSPVSRAKRCPRNSTSPRPSPLLRAVDEADRDVLGPGCRIFLAETLAVSGLLDVDELSSGQTSPVRTSSFHRCQGARALRWSKAEHPAP